MKRHCWRFAAKQGSTARLLLTIIQTPLVAPSANLSGTISPTQADHVVTQFSGKIAGVIDGGRCKVGLESTVIGFSGSSAVLLREGGIPQEEIEAIAGPLASSEDHATVSSPGMLKRHYAPKTKLRLNIRTPETDEVMLGFGPDMPSNVPAGSRNLSVEGDLQEAAANLFAMLHDLDALGAKHIAVMPIPETGLGRAINDRLTRATASP